MNSLKWHHRLIVFLVPWLLLAGCSVFNLSSSTHYSDQEGHFSEQVFSAITPEATTSTWLLQQFGEPIWVDNAANKVKIYTWQFVKEQHKRSDILLLLRHRTVKKSSEFLHAVLRDDILVKHWRDSHKAVDVKRVTYSLGLEPRAEAEKTPVLAAKAQPKKPEAALVKAQ